MTDNGIKFEISQLKQTTADTNTNVESESIFGLKQNDWAVYEELANKSLLSLDKPIPEPETLLSYNGVPILWRGGKAFVCGVAKTRKTTMLTLLSAILSGRNETARGFLTAEGINVLYIDTEQSSFDSWKILKRVSLLCSSTKLPFDIRNANTFSVEQIRQLLEYLLVTNHYDIVILDNWTDCVTSIMEETECVQFSRQLRMLADKFQVGILSVIHANQTDNNEMPNFRGWAKEEERKSDLSMFLLDMGEYSKVKFGRCRGMKPEPFFVSHDENGLPCFYDEQETPEPINPDRYASVVAKMSDNGMTYTNLSKLIAFEMGLKDNTAKRHIPKMLSCGVIVRDNRLYYKVKKIV